MDVFWDRMPLLESHRVRTYKSLCTPGMTHRKAFDSLIPEHNRGLIQQLHG